MKSVIRLMCVLFTCASLLSITTWAKQQTAQPSQVAGNQPAKPTAKKPGVIRFGRNSNTETVTMRFVRGKAGWIASKD